MFAQALITIILTWAVAEIGCRVVLGMTFVTAIKEIFSSDPDPLLEANEDLVDLLRRRREELQVARVRLRLTAKATGVTENLKIVEQELEELETRLADLEHQRSGIEQPS